MRVRVPHCGSEWTSDGQLWVQYVSSTPATRLDVINLQVRRPTPAASCVACRSSCTACMTSLSCGLLVPRHWVRDTFCAQEQLDQKLQQRQARETGICPIREELYAQCFGTTPLRRVMYQLQAQCRDGGGRGWLRYRTTAALRSLPVNRFSRLQVLSRRVRCPWHCVRERCMCGVCVSII